MFVGRDRPNDFVFPACKECNEASRNTDSILSLLALTTVPDGRRVETQMQKLVKGVRNNCPKSFSELRKSRVGTLQKEKLLRQKGYDLKVINLTPHLLSHIEFFAKKMVCSVYYKDSGKILNDCYWYCHTSTVLNYIENRIPNFDFNFENWQTLSSGCKSKIDEFEIAYCFNAIEQAGMVKFYLHNQFAITCMFSVENNVEQSLKKLSSVTAPLEEYTPTVYEAIGYGYRITVQ